MTNPVEHSDSQVSSIHRSADERNEPLVAIEIEGAPTLAESREADRLSGRRYIVFRELFIRMVVFVALVAILGLALSSDALVIGSIALLGSGLSGFMAARYAYGLIHHCIRETQEFKQGEGYFLPTRVRISEAALHATCDSATESRMADYKWELFRGYRASESIVLLYYDLPGGYLTAARSTFSSERQWEAFVALVSSKLPRI